MPNCKDTILNFAAAIDANCLHSEVSAVGTFLGSKYAIQQFLQQDLDEHKLRGSIINISSVAGLAGMRECVRYTVPTPE